MNWQGSFVSIRTLFIQFRISGKLMADWTGPRQSLLGVGLLAGVVNEVSLHAGNLQTWLIAFQLLVHLMNVRGNKDKTGKSF